MTGGRGYARPFGPRYDNLRYGEMPDRVSSYVCKAFEVIKSRAGDKPDKIFDVLYRKKATVFWLFLSVKKVNTKTP